MSEEKKTEDIVDVAPLLDKDPAELADNEKDLAKVVDYLRIQRKNVANAAAAGKKPTAKARKTKTEDKKPEENPINKLMG
jgi:septal ring factor EnvC (AmiA/AmiB activator)